MKKRDIVKIIIYNSDLIIELNKIIKKQKSDISNNNFDAIQKICKEAYVVLRNTIDIANDLGLNSDIFDQNIIYDKNFCRWAYPKKMEDVFPSEYRHCEVEMDDVEKSFNSTIEIPLRKAMKILMKKGWITDYSSANYKDAEGERYNMFVDRSNVAFIRFHDSYLSEKDRAVLMPGNYGLSFIYTHIWPEKSVEVVEQELVELAQSLPQPSYAKNLEYES